MFCICLPLQHLTCQWTDSTAVWLAGKPAPGPESGRKHNVFPHCSAGSSDDRECRSRSLLRRLPAPLLTWGDYRDIVLTLSPPTLPLHTWRGQRLRTAHRNSSSPLARGPKPRSPSPPPKLAGECKGRKQGQKYLYWRPGKLSK